MSREQWTGQRTGPEGNSPQVAAKRGDLHGVELGEREQSAWRRRATAGRLVWILSALVVIGLWSSGLHAASVPGSERPVAVPVGVDPGPRELGPSLEILQDVDGSLSVEDLGAFPT